MNSLKDRVYQIIEVAPEEERGLSWQFDMVLMTLILLNVLAIILETVPSLQAQYSLLFYYFEIVSVVFFSIEFSGCSEFFACSNSPAIPRP